ncbi:thiamine phosphate synthase, partial [Acinetobacter baumannii]
GSDIDEIISSVCILCKQHNTPVLINNQWKWLNRFDFDGVHFDELPNNFSFIKQQIGRDFICGITCNNNISVVEKANNEHVDYISFCSMFP